MTVVLLFQQVIYNQVLADLSMAVRAKLIKQKAHKVMENARAEGKPPASTDMQELIDQLERGDVPQRFRDLYQGHISAKIKGMAYSKYSCLLYRSW